MSSKNEYYTIYGIKLIDVDEIRYIGLTKYKIEVRLKQHLKDKVNLHKINWLKKYRNDIEIIPIETNIPNLQDAIEKEIKYIKEYRDLKGYRLLNYSEGGGGHTGRKVSDEIKTKISNKLKGRIRPLEEIEKSKNSKKINKYYHSEITKTKISNSKKGDKNPMYGKIPNNAKKVYQYDLNGFFIKEFESIKKAKDETSSSKILRVIKGEQKHSGGFFWSFEKS